MCTPGSRARAAGLAILLISVSAGINFGGLGLLLCFAAVIASVGLVGVGVLMADDNLLPVVPAVFGGARALAAFLRRHLAVVGLIVASSAVTAVSGHDHPVVHFAMLALFLLGLSLIRIGVTGE
ncbi:unnamed protein product [Urochloa decumbens]|uniref:Uncharacterized protein n=1 Tax=Urochloa decumbens TaxID=240449 RepID=A0ABC9B952_9POAL